MTDAQRSAIKRSARILAAVEFAIFATIFLVSLIWRFNENFTAKKMLTWFGFFGFVSVLTGYLYYQCELNYVAVKQALRSTTKHLIKNQGQWPQSWEQLKESAENDFDLDWASSRVAINFDADPETLTWQRPRDFNAIKYKAPCFVPNREIAELQTAILKTTQQKPDSIAE